MAVTDSGSRVQYTATSSQTVFAYPFEINVDGDLKVYKTPVGTDASDADDILILTTNYTVSGAGGDSGGNVTLVVGATTGDILTIERDVSVARSTDYQNLGDLASASFNTDLDNIIMMIQQNEALLSRALRISHADSLVSDTTLPVPVAGDIFVWNVSASALDARQPSSVGLLTMVTEDSPGNVLTILGDSANVNINSPSPIGLAGSSIQLQTDGANVVSFRVTSSGFGIFADNDSMVIQADDLDLNATNGDVTVYPNAVGGVFKVVNVTTPVFTVTPSTSKVLCASGVDITMSGGGSIDGAALGANTAITSLVTADLTSTGITDTATTSTQLTLTDTEATFAADVVATGISFDAGTTTLDTYVEKISFTPVIYGVTTAGTPTYTTQYGYYWRTGNAISFTIEIALSALGGMAGSIKISGLPAASAATNPALQSVRCGFFTGMAAPAGYPVMTGLIAQNQSLMSLYVQSNTTISVVGDSYLTAASRFVITGTYTVD